MQKFHPCVDNYYGVVFEYLFYERICKLRNREFVRVIELVNFYLIERTVGFARDEQLRFVT